MIDSINRKVKLSVNSNEAMSDSDDYLTELICVLEVEEMSKNFAGSLNINSTQSLSDIKSKPSDENANRYSETSSKGSPNKLYGAETLSADRLRETALENASVEADCERLNSNEKFAPEANDQAFELGPMQNDSKVEAPSKASGGSRNINSSQCLSEIKKKQSSDNGSLNTKTRSRQNKSNKHHSRANASSSDRFHDTPLENVSMKRGRRGSYSKETYVLDRSQYSDKIKNKQRAFNGNGNTETYSRSRQNDHYNRTGASYTDRSLDAPFGNIHVGAGRGLLYSKYANEYAFKLQCDSKVNPTSKSFEGRTNTYRSIHETMKKPTVNYSGDQNVETFSRRKQIKNDRRAKPSSSSDSLHNTPLESISVGGGRGRLYSNELANQPLPNELDPRLLQMIEERTEQSRLATAEKNKFEAVLEVLDKKLDKKSFIENWIYDCNKHRHDHMRLSQSNGNNYSFINSNLRKTERGGNSAFQNLENVVNSESRKTERDVNSGFQNLERVANSESRETKRLNNQIPRETKLTAYTFRGKECAPTTELQEKESDATSEFRGKRCAATPEFEKQKFQSTNLIANSELFFKPEYEKIMGPTDGSVTFKSGNEETASNIEKESLLLVESHRSSTDSSVIEVAHVSRENVSVRTERSNYFNPVNVNSTLEWSPLDPVASEFNISQEYFPPLQAANFNSFNALNGAFSSNNCFIPTRPIASFIGAPIMPLISSFPIPEPPTESVERILVVENLPKTVLKSQLRNLFSSYGFIKEINIENTLHYCRAYLRADKAVLEWITTLNGYPVSGYGFEGSEALRFNIYYHV